MSLILWVSIPIILNTKEYISTKSALYVFTFVSFQFHRMPRRDIIYISLFFKYILLGSSPNSSLNDSPHKIYYNLKEFKESKSYMSLSFYRLYYRMSRKDIIHFRFFSLLCWVQTPMTHLTFFCLHLPRSSLNDSPDLFLVYIRRVQVLMTHLTFF
jgi:hypothetical protein